MLSILLVDKPTNQNLLLDVLYDMIFIDEENGEEYKDEDASEDVFMNRTYGNLYAVC